VRNRELFGHEPFGITTDEEFTDELTPSLSRGWQSEACFTHRQQLDRAREGTDELGRAFGSLGGWGR
jgi:hypothetical protein